MSTTTAPASQYKAKLSCNHVVEVGPEARVGHRVAKCDKCQAKAPNLRTRTRAIKAIREVPTGKLVDGKAVWSGPVATDTGVEHGPFRSLVAEAAQENRIDAVTAARAEHASLTAWVKGGRKGTQPATPHLDALNAQHAAGKPARQARQAGPKRQPRQVAFTINGHVLNAHNQVVSSLAWQATKGLGEDGGRLTTTQLRALLAEQGITEPEARPWSFTLANGKVIGGVALDS
jgi:hypothetical protein